MSSPFHEGRVLTEGDIDDLEDACLGAAVLERIRLGQEQTYSLEEVVAELGLDPSDFGTDRGELNLD